MSVWTISHSLAVLGAIFLLFSSRKKNPHQPLVTVTAALFLLLWVAIDLYGFSHLGLLRSLKAVAAFYFIRHLFMGISFTLLILCFASARAQKTVLAGSFLLLVAFYGYLVAHYGWGRLLAIGFARSGSGIFIGMASAALISLWFTRRKTPTGGD